MSRTHPAHTGLLYTSPESTGVNSCWALIVWHSHCGYPGARFTTSVGDREGDLVDRAVA